MTGVGTQYSLKDLLDIERLQELMHSFFNLTGIPSALITLEGEVLTSAGWQRVCSDFHRKHPLMEKDCIESDKRINEELMAGAPHFIYRCPRGLTDACIPIVVDGKNMGGMFTGQFFTEEPDAEAEKGFLEQARHFGIDPEEYLRAMREVPVFPEARVTQILQFLGNFTQLLATQGLQKKELELGRRRTEHLLRIVEYQPKGIKDFLEFALSEAVELTESKVGCIYFYSEETKEFTLSCWSKGVMDACAVLNPEARYRLENTGLWGEAVRQRRAILDNDFSSPGPWKKGMPEGHAPLSRFLSVPVFSGDRIVAVVGVGNKESNYGEMDIAQLTLLMDSVWARVEANRMAEEKRAVEAQLIHSSKLAALGTLAAGVAHEINNPLAIIKGYCALLADGMGGSDYSAKSRDILKKIELSSDRIATIVSGLRKFARADQEELVRLDINREIREVLSLCEHMFRVSGISVKLDLRAEPSFIMAVSGHLQQVFMNLVSNSRDAIGEKKNGTIRIETRNVHDLVRVLISDNGCGISSDNRERVFDPFFTTKAPGVGTGLGLSISRSLIESFGGKIHIDSALDLGTTVTMDLPCETKASEKKSLAGEQGRPLSKISGRILIIDDEPEMLALLKESVERLGLAVRVCSDPIRALEQLSHEMFDYCLVDLKMPQMGGDVLIEKASALGLSTRFLVMSGCVLADYTPEERQRIESYARGFLDKPFDMSALYEQLTKMSS